MNKLITLIIASIFSLGLTAQSEIEFRTDGIVVPRTTTEAVTSPVEGIMIYDTVINNFRIFNGFFWTGLGAFENINGLVRQSIPRLSTDNFIFGRNQLPQDGEENLGHFFFYDQTKSAFRGGSSNGDRGQVWGQNFLGTYSFAYGSGNWVDGSTSAAFGSSNRADGISSFVSGYLCRAEGSSSTAFGIETHAFGEASVAIGHGTDAIGEATLAIGLASDAIGEATFAGGIRTFSTGKYCHTIGCYNDSIVARNFALGPTSPLFIVGNGDVNNRSNAMVIRKDGHVGIGTNEPDSPVEISFNSNGSISHLNLHEDATGDFARIDFTNTSGDEKWTIAGRARATGSQANAGLNFFYSDVTNNVLELFGTGDAQLNGILEVDGLVNPSDVRLKKNVTQLTGVISKLENLHGYNYTLISKPERGDQIGLIAQEVQGAFPELVVEDDEGSLAVNYTQFTAVLLQAIKEQQDIIVELQEEIIEIKKTIQN